MAAKKFRFASKGELTIQLSHAYKEVVRNDVGDPISSKIIPGKQAVFSGCYFETDDPDVAKLLQEHPQHWGNDVFWHPSMVDEKNTEDKAKAEQIQDAALGKKQRRVQQQKAAIEGAVSKEED